MFAIVFTLEVCHVPFCYYNILSILINYFEGKLRLSKGAEQEN